MEMEREPMDDMLMEKEPMDDMPVGDGIEIRGKFVICNGWKYEPCEGGYCLYGFDWEEGSLDDEKLKCLNIPRELNGKPVVGIKKNAFNYIAYLQLESLIIPDTVVNIDAGAFEGMSRWKKLSLTIDSGNPEYSVKYGNFCSKDGKTLLVGIGKGDDNEVFVVPDGTVAIGGGAFTLGYYKGIIVPLSVKEISPPKTCWETVVGSAFPREVHRFRYFETQAERNKYADKRTDVYYMGRKKDWKKIAMDFKNKLLLGQDYSKIDLYFYSEKPKKGTWHFASDGVTPEVTKKK